MSAKFLIFFLFIFQSAFATISLGIDRLFTPEYEIYIKGKRVGLITNHSAIDAELRSTQHIFKLQNKKKTFTLVALFAPEHGLNGNHYANEEIVTSKDPDGITVYSLYGETRRPTKAMLQNINLLVYDIQDIGSRSYTYISTLFYIMEEAAKLKIPVLVLDRPNPINGIMVDGPMLNSKWRSIVGYINVPYCHGMTIGELASFFNAEYKIGCDLKVIPMKGWKRTMTFHDTELHWIPTSPQIPEASTALYYPATGLLGELEIVNIGIGYSLPFKVVGAPWINALEFTAKLNAQNFSGVYFYPFYFRPFFGRYAKKDCQGVLIKITDPLLFKPVTTQFLLIGILKSLYPKEFEKVFHLSKEKIEMFNKLTGTTEVYRIIKEEKYISWALKGLHQKERAAFLEKRKKYLIKEYN